VLLIFRDAPAGEFYGVRSANGPQAGLGMAIDRAVTPAAAINKSRQKIVRWAAGVGAGAEFPSAPLTCRRPTPPPPQRKIISSRVLQSAAVDCVFSRTVLSCVKWYLFCAF
jgi:hypothetical protein